jgi:hypothetical protein
MHILAEIESFLTQYRNDIVHSKVETIQSEDGAFDIHLIELCGDHTAPKNGYTLLLVAGVHGLEWIGVTVLLHHLTHLIETSRWNAGVRSMINSARIIAIPALNPTGIFQGRRATAQGIDLMRNAPIQAEAAIPFLGGHTLSPVLPYYRGTGELAPESRALIRVVENLLETSTGVVALDLHSGFGAKDRVWTPWSMTSAPPPYSEHYSALERALNDSFPDHIYTFERQSDSYQTHGDLWDFLLVQNIKRNGPLFMPLTLEMGSWNWLKKAPWNAFTKLGWFHPLAPHRIQRACRRHLTLLDFLVSVCANGNEFFSKKSS